MYHTMIPHTSDFEAIKQDKILSGLRDRSCTKSTQKNALGGKIKISILGRRCLRGIAPPKGDGGHSQSHALSSTNQEKQRVEKDSSQ